MTQIGYLTKWSVRLSTLFKKILRSLSESTMISFLRSAEKAINHLELLYIPVSTKNDESIFIVKGEESLFYDLAIESTTPVKYETCYICQWLFVLCLRCFRLRLST